MFLLPAGPAAINHVPSVSCPSMCGRCLAKGAMSWSCLYAASSSASLRASPYRLSLIPAACAIAWTCNTATWTAVAQAALRAGGRISPLSHGASFTLLHSCDGPSRRDGNGIVTMCPRIIAAACDITTGPTFPEGASARAITSRWCRWSLSLRRCAVSAIAAVAHWSVWASTRALSPSGSSSTSEPLW